MAKNSLVKTVDTVAKFAPPFPIHNPETMMGMNILIYGESGVGKTVLAASAQDDERLGPVLFGDCESGTLSLRDQWPNIDIVKLAGEEKNSAGEIVTVDFQIRAPEIYSYLADTNHPYKTFVADSLTEAQKQALYSIMQDVVAVKTDRDADVPQLQDWGKNLEVMRRFVRYNRDLPVNFICTALEVESKDERTGALKVGPSFTGKMAREIPAFFDFVLRLYTVRTKDNKGEEVITRRLLCQPTGKYSAKDRSGKLGIEIENPTMTKILDMVLEKRGGK